MNGFCEIVCEICGKMIANQEVDGVWVCDDCLDKGEE